MGTWGGGIYEDDEAQDAREANREILRSGLDDAQATDKFLKEWKAPLKDSDDGPVIWFALADAQWTLGRLDPRVRDAAIRLIDDESSLDRWKEAGDKALAKRRKVLLALREKLLSPQPPRKKLRIEKPVKPLKKGAALKPAELRRQLKQLYCNVEPSRGASLTSVVCPDGMTDTLLAALLSCAETLEQLHLESSPKLTDEGLELIGQFRRLKRLALRCMPLNDRQLAWLKCLPQLESVELRGRLITDVGVAPLAACSNLICLDLSGTSIGDATLAWASERPGLRELWLRSTKVTDAGLAALARHAGLKQLYLAGADVTDRSAKHVASLPQLVWLDLAETKITDRAVKELSTSKSLRALDLEKTEVTDACVAALLKMNQLCYLNVDRTGISTAGLARLKEHLPLLGNQEAIRAVYRGMRSP
ncbi:MAG: hypothetical protein U0939_13685 [Pirellulales bacterium]